MSSNFDSSTPLAYTGLNQHVNPPTISVNRAPLSTDWQSFNPGDLWRDTSASPQPVTYICESVFGNVAVWQQIASNSSIIDGAHGGTGIANTGLTINLGSPTSGYVLTSDAFGNATWHANTAGSVPPAGVVTSDGVGFTNVASTTPGRILQATAAAATPAFSTATYPSTTTANEILYSSAANTVGQITASPDGVLISSHTNVPSFLPNGTAGYVLTANTNLPPSWQPSSGGGSGITQVLKQVLTTSTTYTKTAGMVYVMFECVGGGGGGGGAAATPGNGNIAVGSGGGAGGYSNIILATASVVGPQTVTIGAGGTGGVGAGAAGAGTATSVAALCVASGGIAGVTSGLSPTPIAQGSLGGVGTTGQLLSYGGPGGSAMGIYGGVLGTIAMSGAGGNSIYGGGGISVTANAASGAVAGNAGSNFGAGGSGAVSVFTSAAATGGAGSSGVVIITEFIH